MMLLKICRLHLTIQGQRLNKSAKVKRTKFSSIQIKTINMKKSMTRNNLLRENPN